MKQMLHKTGDIEMLLFADQWISLLVYGCVCAFKPLCSQIFTYVFMCQDQPLRKDCALREDRPINENEGASLFLTLHIVNVVSRLVSGCPSKWLSNVISL